MGTGAASRLPRREAPQVLLAIGSGVLPGRGLDQHLLDPLGRKILLNKREPAVDRRKAKQEAIDRARETLAGARELERDLTEQLRAAERAATQARA